jgi:IS30 family transposase
MGKNYNQLSPEERDTISYLYREGKTNGQIATTLGRATSTITRELERNKIKTNGYSGRYAQQLTASRRWKGSRLERQPALRSAVMDKLTMGWSPQQTSHWLAQEQGCKIISYESIYRFIYAQIARTKDYSWRNYLRRRKSKRGWYRRRGGGSATFIKHRVSIDKRPQYIEKRASPGHWEVDLMLFSKYGQSLLVAQERQSRMLMLFILKNKRADGVVNQLSGLLGCLPKSLAKTVTFDNGSEFAQHHQLNNLGIKTYFCDVKSPWQKGGVENAIGRLRAFLPRKTDLAELNNQDIERVVAHYNHTPRKCLGYKTPAQIFTKHLVHFKREFTFPPARE